MLKSNAAQSSVDVRRSTDDNPTPDHRWYAGKRAVLGVAVNLFRTFGAAGAIALAAGGCASSSNEIKASYVSPLQYQQYNCQQIAAEADRVSRKAAELSGVQDTKASNDAVATGVALVLFWPAALLVKGDGSTAAELARLKGEFETLEKVSIEKNCGLRFGAQPPPAPSAKPERKPRAT
jgi:hypothetical protein